MTPVWTESASGAATQHVIDVPSTWYGANDHFMALYIMAHSFLVYMERVSDSYLWEDLKKKEKGERTQAPGRYQACIR